MARLYVRAGRSAAQNGGCPARAVLFYVTLLVPIRVGFGVNPAPGSGGFFVDAAVDLYFVCDLCPGPPGAGKRP